MALLDTWIPGCLPLILFCWPLSSLQDLRSWILGFTASTAVFVKKNQSNIDKKKNREKIQEDEAWDSPADVEGAMSFSCATHRPKEKTLLPKQTHKCFIKRGFHND